MDSPRECREFQAHLKRLCEGQPLVRLNDEQATLHAARLHEQGMAWSAIALVMSIYHDQWMTRTGWYRRWSRAQVKV